VTAAPIPDELLAVQLPAPDWFHWAVGRPKESRFVTVEDCPIHYLRWRAEPEATLGRGILFVHGGGAHANWWSFIAPYFTRDFTVAAIDLSGMGDSGRRPQYGSEIRALELRAVIADAGLGPNPFIVGHSFGGYMTMKFASRFGEELGGIVIVDSAIRTPEEEARQPMGGRRRMGHKRLYPSFAAAVERFRLMPEQSCDNPFIIEFIARHSVMPEEGGWAWKFDGEAMGARRFGEPFREYLQAVNCRAALIFGEKSKLVSRDTASYMSEVMGPRAPIVEIPEAQHHVMLDQPLAFVAALRTLLQSWIRLEG
jgi:pimeloyl-ACP methyl ester carboxylesterase